MRIEVVTIVRAPRGVCFDLARSVDAHVRSFAHTGERAVAGRTSGLLQLGDEVTWRARHLGLVHRHRARITAFDRPAHFRDTMVAGRFRSFEHDHWFTTVDGATHVRDVLEFRSPAGWLGRLVDRCVLAGHLRRLLQQRAAVLRDEAEAIASAR
ncbi:MAG TPA: SRPBCC family protein [Planctomycetota bacterium]